MRHRAQRPRDDRVGSILAVLADGQPRVSYCDEYVVTTLKKACNVASYHKTKCVAHIWHKNPLGGLIQVALKPGVGTMECQLYPFSSDKAACRHRPSQWA
jgi:hypothetical protein